MIELVNCPICHCLHWKYLDYLRDASIWREQSYRDYDEPVGFKICLNCGFVTYDYKETERLMDGYDRERKIMRSDNIVTCNRKNMYHKRFLDDCVSGKRAFLDVGCAQGAFLNLLKKLVPDGDFYGTEWSDGFAAFGHNEYGLTITKDIDESRVYDFISYYHVLEHIQSPDIELDKIRNILEPDGLLYISVPVFFDILDEASGGGCMSFEHLYHLNHVNVFTKKSFRNLLKRKGFRIIKEDDKMYGYTVLCEKTNTFIGAGMMEIDNPAEIEERLNNQKRAIESLVMGDYEKALEYDETYCDAYIAKSLSKENMKDINLQRTILEEAYEKTMKSPKILGQIARMYYQWDESKKNETFYSANIKMSEKMFKQLADEKQGSEDAYFYLGLIEGKYKKDYDKAVEYLKKVIEINPGRYMEIYNFISHFWKERGCKTA